MKPLSIMSCLGLCTLPMAFGDDPIPVPIELAPANDGMPVKVETERMPAKYAKEKAVAIKLEDLQHFKRGSYKAIFRIINPTQQQISYTGYSETSPMSKRQLWKQEAWEEVSYEGLCGVGLRDCYVAAGDSAVFEVILIGNTLPARIGIRYREPDKDMKKFFTVWSEKIER